MKGVMKHVLLSFVLFQILYTNPLFLQSATIWMGLLLGGYRAEGHFSHTQTDVNEVRQPSTSENARRWVKNTRCKWKRPALIFATFLQAWAPIPRSL